VPGIGIGDRVVVSNAPVVTLSATGVTSTRSCSVASSVPVKPGVTSKSGFDTDLRRGHAARTALCGRHQTIRASVAATVPKLLKPGDKAPDFTLVDQNGEPFTLSKSLKQRKAWHLIYF
jgi:hypothetical protein